MPPDPTDTLDTIATWWIKVGCACGRSAAVPVKLLIQRHGAGVRPADLVARMKCSACDKRPIEVALVDDPQVGARGYVCNDTMQRVEIDLP